MNPTVLVFLVLVSCSSVLVGLTLRRAGSGFLGARWAVSGVAACSAVWAAGAGCKPVGRPIPDAVFAGAGCAALVFAGAVTAPTASTTAAFGACIALAAGSTASGGSLVLGGAALGLASSGLIDRGDRRQPINRFVGASCAALLGNSLLRLPTDLPTRFPSLVAGVLGAVVVVATLPGASRRIRRLVGVSTLFVAALGGLFAALAMRQALVARRSADAGIAMARQALATARAGEADEAAAEFRRAARLLSAANATLNAPQAAPGRFLPIVAPNLAASRELATSAAAVSFGAADAAGAVEISQLRTPDGRVDVDRIARLSSPLENVRSAVDRAIAALEGSKGPWIAPSLTKKAESFETELIDARASAADAAQIINVLPDLLGRGGPRRYLLIVPTPAEARGSGGQIGNYGELNADGGRLSLTRFGRLIELDTNGVPGSQRVLRARPDYLRRYSKFKVSQLWENVTLSPDFPSAAEAMSGLYPQSGGSKIDGVISADPFALAAILKLTGPVALEGWPEAITSDNAARILLHDWYDQLTEERSSERIDLQGRLATEAWSRLLRPPFPGPAALAAALGDAARGRHFQLWAVRPTEQAFFERLGVDGGMRPLTSDGFTAITTNAGANKIEWYLARSIGYDAVVDLSTGQVDATATVSMFNGAPSSGAARYLIGNQATPPAPNGTNVQYLSLYSPLNLQSVTVNGDPTTFTSETELGRNVYSLWLRIPPGGRAVVSASLSGLVKVDKGYSLDMGCQALVNPDVAEVNLRVNRALPALRSTNLKRTANKFRFQGPLECRKLLSIQPEAENG